MYIRSADVWATIDRLREILTSGSWRIALQEPRSGHL